MDNVVGLLLPNKTVLIYYLIYNCQGTTEAIICTSRKEVRCNTAINCQNPSEVRLHSSQHAGLDHVFSNLTMRPQLPVLFLFYFVFR